MEKTETSYNPLEKCKEIINKFQPDKIVATGYGRHLVEKSFKDLNILTITEIKAFSLGAKYFNSKVRTIIDIGGQDTKIIGLDEKGKVLKFEMNDKCSAGTGRFLEIMTKALGYDLKEVINFSIDCEEVKIKINSMCTVFAESEVISMIAKGIERDEILKAIHYAIAHRIAGMIKRVSLEEDIIFAGGCATNKMLKTFIEKEIKRKIKISSYPQFLGAIGAAISITL